LYGVIEGFYGPAWTQQARLDLLRLLGDCGLDSYVYAPKSDPFHRGARWMQPWPEEELVRFGELAEVGRSGGVRVVVALSPATLLGRRNLGVRPDPDGDGINDRQLRALLDKLSGLQRAGVRGFALLFDDLPATFVRPLASRGLGRFHARVGARVLEELRRWDPGVSLFLVPPLYFGTWEGMGRSGRGYWSGLAELPDEVPVAWTGPRVFSRRIEGDAVARIRAETGLRLVIWNNEIANDWLPLATGAAVRLRGWQKLSFGPVRTLAPDLAAQVEGVLLNGAQEPVLTGLTAASLADWRNDPASYDPDTSFAAALERVAGDGASVLARVHDLCRRRLAVPVGREAEELSAALSSRDRGAVRRALEGIAGLEAEAEGLAPELLTELRPTLRKAHLLASAALDGDRAGLTEARRIRWLVAHRALGRAQGRG
jgi:hyaluronoglucosaminidase